MMQGEEDLVVRTGVCRGPHHGRGLLGSAGNKTDSPAQSSAPLPSPKGEQPLLQARVALA